MRLDWSECKRAFYVDGSLRDIYVATTTVADWGIFLELVSSFKTASFVDGEPEQIPAKASEIFDKNDDTSYLLKIELGKVTLNCHFFTVEEIELDIDPKEVTSQQELDAVCDMLFKIGNTLNKDVVLTDENSPDSSWFIYESSTEKLKFLGDRWSFIASLRDPSGH